MSPPPAMLRQSLADGLRGPMAPYVYTYPPKRAYSPVDPTRDMAATWSGYDGPLNVYVHVPYCRMKCGFCNLFTTKLSGSLDPYAAALHRELSLVAAHLADGVQLASVHFGGGTPTLLAPAVIGGLLADLTGRYALRPGAEVAIEGTPRSLTADTLRGLHDAGITRVSIGIQSFDRHELDAMGRGSQSDPTAVVEAALQQGFDNVNLDLIYGLPSQSLDVFLANLERAVALGPPTLTLYPLVLRQRTAFGARSRRGDEGFAGSDELFRAYDRALELLAEHGYEQRTLVLYARPGGGNGFEEEEFRGVPTLGLGAGARSYGPRVHYTADDYFQPTPPRQLIEAWLQAVEAGRVPARCAVELAPDDQMRREVILQLLYTGIARPSFAQRWGGALDTLVGAPLEALAGEGLLDDDGERVWLNRQGMKYSSLVARLFYRDGVERPDSGYR